MVRLWLLKDNCEKMSQSSLWAGALGDVYTESNNDIGEFNKRLSFFVSILVSFESRTVLDIGCNRGHNLRVIGDISKTFQGFGTAGWELSGLEINPVAAQHASQYGTIIVQDLKDKIPGTYDLVMALGVLCHIETRDLPHVLMNITRATKKRLLIADYYSPLEKESLYRTDGRLYRRPWDRIVEKLPFKLIDGGPVGKDHGFDNLHFWFLEKKV